MRRGHVLLELLLVAIAAHGLAPDALDPFRGWVVFKQYARSVAETPDPGVSIQITPHDEEGTVSLVFLRQEVEQDDSWLAPTGGVACEFIFALGSRQVVPLEAWSFDAPSFDRFVDLVEEHPGFQDLVVARPVQSAVYWIEA